MQYQFLEIFSTTEFKKTLNPLCIGDVGHLSHDWRVYLCHLDYVSNYW